MAQKKTTDTNRRLQEIVQDLGKVPPQAIEIEEAVLGALMLEKDAAASVIDILQAESFYKDTHRVIYECILNLSVNHEPIDLLTVTEELKNQGKLEMIGGPYYLTQLTSKVASAAHVEYHARIVAQKYIQRELIRVSSDIQEKAFDSNQDVDELLDFAEGELFNVAFGNIKKETQKIHPTWSLSQQDPPWEKQPSCSQWHVIWPWNMKSLSLSFLLKCLVFN
jgi:replicative DNA helicase